MEKIKKGQLWKHYKNNENLYEIIGVGKNSENLEQMVIYKALYKGDFPIGQIWVRPEKMFLEKIIKNGKKIKRFTLVKDI